ncbi:TPA: hypothetical protein NG682_000964 [Vibrio parahaemolyticus]|nr:hypothetical protein [Vibrio parahaemolyticus]
MNKIKRIIFTTFFITLLSGCNFTEQLNDESCITSFNDLKSSNDQFSLFKADGGICQSLDIGARRNKAEYLKYKPFSPYSENQFLDEETAIRYNVQAQQKYDSAVSSRADKKKILGTSIYSWALTALIVIFLIHRQLFQNASEQGKNKNIKFFATLVCMMILIQFLARSDLLNVIQVRATLETGNYLARSTMIAELKEFENTAIKGFTDHSDNEAILDVLALTKINVCLSRTQNYHIEENQYAMNLFDSPKAIHDFYYKKNEPFIIGQERDERKIGYRIGDAGLLVGVEIANCGVDKFSSSNVSQSTFQKLIAIDFKDTLHNAIIGRSYYEGGLKLKAAYISEYRDTLYSHSNLKEILDLYSKEYKKGLIWGSVKTSNEYYRSTVIDSNFDNLMYLQSLNDQIAKNLSKSQCVRQGAFVKETNKQITEYLSDQAYQITEFECVDFADDTVQPLNPVAYLYEDNKTLVDQSITMYKEASYPIAQEAVDYLKAEYKKVNEGYLKLMEGMSNHEKILVHYYNQGAEAQSDFLSYINKQSNNMIRVYAELIDVHKFEYTQALPDFNLEENPPIDTTISQVNAHLKPLIEAVDTKTEFVANDLTTSMLEYTLDDSSFINDAANGDTQALKSGLTEYANITVNRLSRMGRFACNGDKDKCADVQENFEGFTEWNRMSEDLKELAKPLIVVGLTGYVSGAASEAFVNFGKHKNKDDHQAIFGKNSKVGAVSSLVEALKDGSYFLMILGTALYVLSLVMDAIYYLPTIPATWHFLTQFYFFELFSFMSIVFVASVMQTAFTFERQRKALLFFLLLYVSPITLSVLVASLNYLNYTFLELIINYIPTISGLTLGSDHENVLDQIINLIFSQVSLFVGIFILSIFIIKSTYSSSAKMMNDLLVDNSIEEGNRVLDQGKNVTASVVGYNAMKKTMNKVSQNKQKRKEREKDKQEN